MAVSGNTEVWTVQRLLTWTRGHFERIGLDEPRLCAELLLAHALGCRKIDLYARFEAVPDDAQRTAFRELVQSAAKHTPIAYLIGRKEFYSLEFEVTPAVLIPRPETELLVERVIEHCRQHPRERWDLLDFGTGSGCIAVAVAKYVPAAHVVGSDISSAALEVARRNVERHGLGDRIRLTCCDGLALSEDIVPQGGFDLIVSNPPYVTDEQMADLPPEVGDHEPAEALSAGPDGLRFFRLLGREAPGLLQPGGALFVEVGCDQHEPVAEALSADGRLDVCGTWRDVGGAHVRVLQFRLVERADE